MVYGEAKARREPGVLQARVRPSFRQGGAARDLRASAFDVRPENPEVVAHHTCFSTHQLYFGHDANNTLWISQGGPQSGVVGWLNTKLYEQTGDEVKAQGWTPIIVNRDHFTAMPRRRTRMGGKQILI